MVECQVLNFILHVVQLSLLEVLVCIASSIILMGVDNFFVVGGGLCCHTQFCDHSYLLLDCHCGSGVLNKLMRKWLVLLAKMKVLYQGLIKPRLDKPLVVHSFMVKMLGGGGGGGGFSPPSPPLSTPLILRYKIFLTMALHQVQKCTITSTSFRYQQ